MQLSGRRKVKTTIPKRLKSGHTLKSQNPMKNALIAIEQDITPETAKVQGETTVVVTPDPDLPKDADVIAVLTLANGTEIGQAEIIEEDRLFVQEDIVATVRTEAGLQSQDVIATAIDRPSAIKEVSMQIC